MAYVKQSWVNGVSPVSASRLNHIEAGIEAAVDQETAEATYAPRPAAPGTDGQVLVKAGDGTAWADAPTGGGSSGGGVFTDTDGTPYFDTSTSGGTSIATDTDGVPYFV